MVLKRRGLANDEAEKPATSYGVIYGLLDTMDQRELLNLRTQIDARLDLGTLHDVDVGQELLQQLRTVQLLQQEASENADSFAHKAQTASVVQRLLTELTKLRTDVYNAERFKQLEDMISKAWHGVEPPPEAKDAFTECKHLFFEQYERLLATLDQDKVEAQG